MHKPKFFIAGRMKRKQKLQPLSAFSSYNLPLPLGETDYSQTKMDALDSVFDPLRDFAKDSVRLVKRCHKPDRKEFTKVATRTAIGFVVMGFVGFFVKLIFIPINNIIVGAS